MLIHKHSVLLLPLLFVKGHFVEILHQSKTIFHFYFFKHFLYLCLKNFNTGYQRCFSFSILLLKATAVPVQWAHTLRAAHSQCRTRTSPCLPSARGTHKAMKKKKSSKSNSKCQRNGQKQSKKSSVAVYRQGMRKATATRMDLKMTTRRVFSMMLGSSGWLSVHITMS